ncbi:hypothetical protein BCR36DRAFT_588061 [Piromyces finnis]|uniref:Uncharacterized protein n=1 Tax=Piromyces finnis TaxID=1754191 RepID=A0A1Y1UV37_9FUNG|nr:hypothetical protein BCR36DRAFT_588061 [Piromyces finnis]|eukprot:ORX41444.1 hypothetical protein BCR36DRAFT_588061 [Piromyces finnis]
MTNISNTPGSEQLVKLVDSKNKSNNPRLDYYKRVLASCYSDIGFQTMVNTINFKEIVPLPKNNSMYRFVVKCYNNASNVIIGAVNDSSDLSLSDLPTLSIPMTHYHLNKNNFIQDSFFHRISNNENNSTNKFICHVRLVDEKIKDLISNYIKNIDMTSPIANLLAKNKVTYNQNWTYTGIINKTKDIEYINFRYFKDPIKEKFKIGTNVYCGDVYSKEVANLLSKNTFCYIHGNIYPIIKVCYVLVNERVINGVPMVNFTCKAYFVDINISSDSLRLSTERL